MSNQLDYRKKAANQCFLQSSVQVIRTDVSVHLSVAILFDTHHEYKRPMMFHHQMGKNRQQLRHLLIAAQPAPLGADACSLLTNDAVP